MILQTEKRYYTPEEYLELEEKAEYKNEYKDGEIIPMTGGTTNHNKIAGNFYKKFPLTVQSQAYDIYIGDVKLAIPRYRIYTYPDVMVIKGKPIYEGTSKTIITNPSLIVEVLSNSTKNYDKTDKFKYYRSIPIFQWIFKEYEGEEAVLVLDSIDFQISLRDIYERVDFELIEE
jgi:Uma2 family endonuclease